jgi:hydrogenase/urease accessory protein HupE
MSNVTCNGLRALAVAVTALLLAPAVGFAHALFGDQDPNRPLVDYLPLGFWHMVGGWDHLLFIAGVVLLAGSVRTAAKLITLFVAGHSLTLLVATLAGWQLNATAVDVVIALSLVYVGLQGWRGRPTDLRLTGAIVFGFGLVHGLGLSTRLQSLGLPDGGLVERILLFNVGVEVGQLVALAVIVGLGTLAVRVLRPSPRARRPAFGLLLATGLVAAAVLSFPSAEPQAERVAGKGGAPTACSVLTSQPPAFPEGDARHPGKRFYGPRETPPREDLGHGIGHGYVVVLYPPGLPRADRRALEDWTRSSPTPYVVAAPEPGQIQPFRVVTAQRELRCSKPDIEGLTAFRDDWFKELRGGGVGAGDP